MSQSSLQEISLKKMLKQFYFTEQFYNRQVINLNLRGIFYSLFIFHTKHLHKKKQLLKININVILKQN